MKIHACISTAEGQRLNVGYRGADREGRGSFVNERARGTYEPEPAPALHVVGAVSLLFLRSWGPRERQLCPALPLCLQPTWVFLRPSSNQGRVPGCPPKHGPLFRTQGVAGLAASRGDQLRQGGETRGPPAWSPATSRAHVLPARRRLRGAWKGRPLPPKGGARVCGLPGVAWTRGLQDTWKDFPQIMLQRKETLHWSASGKLVFPLLFFKHLNICPGTGREAQRGEELGSSNISERPGRKLGRPQKTFLPWTPIQIDDLIYLSPHRLPRFYEHRELGVCHQQQRELLQGTPVLRIARVPAASHTTPAHVRAEQDTSAG
ncbi:uncharacterized protein LOC104866769 [Fukomys damarensis]|uniref:uncharacterized protein LOC104866769 n=1 Tax=Fukomys damarensis TaxID=885580 RepID=UPI00053F3F3C|nr:uncharacterized protein LOC104866769 [Fukomys damarensis]